MNKVLSGEYADAKIGLDGPHRCLFIKCDREKILLVKGPVAQYALKSTLALSSDKIYVVKWGDGAVSTIRIEKPYEQFLISGCESGAASEPAAKKAKQGSALGIFICLVLIAIGFVVAFNIIKNMHQDDSASQARRPLNNKPVSSRTWAEWDGESEKLDADMLVQTTDTIGLTPTSGLASGYFINNSDQTFTHLEAIYELTTDGINKIGECTFATNDVELAPGESQGFTAFCNAWGDTPHIKLSSVGFH